MTLTPPLSRYHKKLRALAEGMGYPPKSEEGLQMAEQVNEHLSRAGYRIIKFRSGVGVAGRRDAGASGPAAAPKRVTSREAAAASLKFYFASAATE